MSLYTNTLRVMAVVLILVSARVFADTIFHDSFELCRVAKNVTLEVVAE